MFVVSTFYYLVNKIINRFMPWNLKILLDVRVFKWYNIMLCIKNISFLKPRYYTVYKMFHIQVNMLAVLKKEGCNEFWYNYFIKNIIFKFKCQ
jgi:hypothetical protein